jgi:thiamine pyrophosphokinase
MRYKNILIICNGEIPHLRVIKNYLPEADLIVCVDGGANTALKLGILPDLIIGDMDSISPRTIKRFKKVKSITTPDQEYTDLDKALNYLLKYKPEIIHIFSAIGNRIDHSLSNLSILKKYKEYCRLIMHTNNSTVEYIDKSIEFNGKTGKTISLIPISKVTNYTTYGLKYPLKNTTLDFGLKESQSNVIESNPVKITFKKGCLFLIQEY